MGLSIQFNDKNYDDKTLQDMTDAELLKLRNLVAANLGSPAVKAFKSHDQAVKATMAALTKWDADDGASLDDAKAAKAKKAAKPKEPLPPAKCASAAPVKRPTRNMFRKLTKAKEHPGKGFRIRRWDNYKDGMTLLECAEGADMTPLDVGYYVKHDLMKLTEPTEDEYQAGLGAWYKKHGLPNPADVKAEKKKEAEKKKQDRMQKAADKKAAAKAKKEQAASAKAA